jgi:hypothetical protein
MKVIRYEVNAATIKHRRKSMPSVTLAVCRRPVIIVTFILAFITTDLVEMFRVLQCANCKVSSIKELEITIFSLFKHKSYHQFKLILTQMILSARLHNVPSIIKVS